MMPCARLLDMHVCTMVTPSVPPIPHVGGPVAGPCVWTVLVGMMPTAVVGDIAICVGPPDTLAMGSKTVLVSSRPCVRILMDMTAHGGMVSGPGCPTVLVGG
jgi:uncharacterized Zn-binding protein involved in type VI secretion